MVGGWKPKSSRRLARSRVARPSSRLHRLAGEDELVHAVAVEGDRQALAAAALGQPRLQVVGVQNGGLRGLGEAVGAEAEDVGVGADEDAEVALEAAQAADRLGPLEVEVEAGPAPFEPSRRITWGRGRKGSIRSETAIGPAPGPPPPWGWLKDLWRLRWTMSKPMSPGPRVAHHRVEVGAVVVEGPSHIVDQRRDLGDVLVEEPERVGVGQHQAGDLVGARPWSAGRPSPPRRARRSPP